MRQREVRRASVKSARQRAENRASAILSLARIIGACQRGNYIYARYIYYRYTRGVYDLQSIVPSCYALAVATLRAGGRRASGSPQYMHHHIIHHITL